jgi:hypothetical protein
MREACRGRSFFALQGLWRKWALPIYFRQKDVCRVASQVSLTPNAEAVGRLASEFSLTPRRPYTYSNRY